MRGGRHGVLLLLLGMLGGCGGHTPVLAPALPPELGSQERLVEDIPFFPQSDYQCGPAALATVLNASGVDVWPDELIRSIYLPGRSGSLQVELVAAVRRHSRVPYPIESGFSELLSQLVAGRPVLVLQNLGWRRFPVWHYAVVIGFDAPDEALILHSGRTKRLRMAAHKFLDSWARADHWGLVVLKAGELPADLDVGRYLKAASAMEGVADAAVVEDVFAAAARRWPDHSLARLGWANALLRQGRHRPAERVYRDLLDDNPRHVAARNNLAQSLMERGCTAAARIELARARDADLGSGGRYRTMLEETERDLDAAEREHRKCRAGAADIAG